MTITVSKLRENIYRALDDVAETGIPIRIQRRGRVLKIEREPSGSKLSALRRRRYLKVDPEEIVHLDWSDQWRP